MCVYPSFYKLLLPFVLPVFLACSSKLRQWKSGFGQVNKYSRGHSTYQIHLPRCGKRLFRALCEVCEVCPCPVPTSHHYGKCVERVEGGCGNSVQEQGPKFGWQASEALWQLHQFLGPHVKKGRKEKSDSNFLSSRQIHGDRYPSENIEGSPIHLPFQFSKMLPLSQMATV